MRFLLPTLILLWLTAAVFGMAQIERFSGTSGALSQPPIHWQSSPTVTLDKTRPTLLMLIHPKCPCTRASLAELDRLAALCPGQVAVSVLVWEPPGYSAKWAQTDLYHEAQSIPGVRVILDKNGAVSRRFRAATSGETFLYALDGRLLYHGGLTGARGQEGDNAGLFAVAALLRGEPGAAHSAPVYGCPLRDCHLRKPERKSEVRL